MRKESEGWEGKEGDGKRKGAKWKRERKKEGGEVKRRLESVSRIFLSQPWRVRIIPVGSQCGNDTFELELDCQVSFSGS